MFNQASSDNDDAPSFDGMIKPLFFDYGPVHRYLLKNLFQFKIRESFNA